MKDVRFFRFFYLVMLLPFFVQAQVTELAMMPASGIVRYDNLPVGQLNVAERQKLSGQFEEALLTYNSALAWQPDWVPALAARSELLSRLGRSLEARRDRMMAERQNPTATAFFLARGRNGLMPFLALYPGQWYRDNYGIIPESQSAFVDDSPQAFFYEQYVSIVNAPDTTMAVRALQQKVNQEVLASRKSVEALPRDYNEGVRKMLMGNLAMLNHEYTEAINLYTDAALKSGVNWPELNYNRGLGNILIHNYMNGCQDLRQAADDGYAPAKVMFNSLCNF